MIFNEDFGLSKDEINNIIEKELEKNADLLVGIDDPEMIEMIGVLKKAFVKSMDENNNNLRASIIEYIDKKTEKSSRRF